MAFKCRRFIYNGVSCDEFDLMVYDMESAKQDNGKHVVREAIEETLNRKYRSLYYGSRYNKPLEFRIVFGLTPKRAERNNPLDRVEIEAINRWLTGHDGYKYLEILQSDMREFRYKARVSELERIDVDWNPWAFQATFTCDSAFGYTYPEEHTFSSDGHKEDTLFSRSTYDGIYSPQIAIGLNSNSERNVVITNESLPVGSRDRSMIFTGVPTAVKTIYIDTDTKVIYTDSGDDVYPFFNFAYTGLVPGENKLVIDGTCSVTFVCEFPVNIGG